MLWKKGVESKTISVVVLEVLPYRFLCLNTQSLELRLDGSRRCFDMFACVYLLAWIHEPSWR